MNVTCELDQPIRENFHVLWINSYDELQSDIKKYFDQTNQFLHECYEKVFVHCQMDVSRSYHNLFSKWDFSRCRLENSQKSNKFFHERSIADQLSQSNTIMVL